MSQCIYNQHYVLHPPTHSPKKTCQRPSQYGATSTTIQKKPLSPQTKITVRPSHHITATSTTPFLQPAYAQETPQELSSWNFFLCSLCLAGVQFTWTVELAYGSPYLLDLGLSKALMSLVWLAGPISGLLVAPILGSYSDHYRSRFGRRRPFMVVSAALSVLSLSLVGYAKLIGYHIATQILTAPSRDELAKMSTHVAIIVAVIGFYLLDFSINSVQASCRALVLDQAPLSQQGLANSWAGRMIGLGNVAGYFVGYLDLPANLPFLGTGQVPALCTIASFVLSATIGITCVSVTEDLDDESTSLQDVDRKFYGTLLDIFSALRKLPTSVQHVCNVQFFAWLGWFPILFYSSTWVTEVMARAYHPEPLDDAFFDNATRAGSFALLLFAAVSLVSSFLVPFLSTEFAIHYTESRFAFWLTPQGIWTFSHFLFAMLMASTLLVDENVLYAQIILAACGICWGISMWVPFALVGAEAARERNGEEYEEGTEDEFEDCLGELESGGYAGDEETGEEEVTTTTGPLSSGMLLGIHNVYIVLPQFVTSVIAACVFAVFSGGGGGGGGEGDGSSGGRGRGGGIGSVDDHDSVGWVLRIGGLSALVAGMLSYSYYRGS